MREKFSETNKELFERWEEKYNEMKEKRERFCPFLNSSCLREKCQIWKIEKIDCGLKQA